ncbi:MAG TPA: serine/threonine-protein kinase, partial [Gemmatimonadales bacterium]|nr:serine/threonine-protein kinase [Gemmatimonadales bacterium]
MLIERVRRALAPDYEILEEIAGGGMGLVFAARQRRLDRKVALKILRPEHATAIAAERFLAEGRVLARLAHPGIVPVYDAGEADGLLYYVMEFVEGETLADRLSRGALSPGEAMRLAEDLLGALSAAHALGVVHRDVKPANIFLRDGHALLGDFGIARWREKDEPGYTTPGELIGTPRYMSPEQRDGSPTTLRSDVYAAGLVLWEACTGARWPFYQPPKDADWSKLPPALAPAIRRALELEPEQRWENARQFLAAVNRAARRRARPRALLAAVLILAVGIAGYWILKPPPPSPNRAALTLEIPTFRTSGVNPKLGDSVALALRASLAGYPDFYVSDGPQRGDASALRIAGMLTGTDGKLQLTALAVAHPEIERLQTAQIPVGAWRSQVDTLEFWLLRSLWQSPTANNSWVPREVLPRTDRGFAQWLKGEQNWAHAQWEEALEAYQAGEQDTTCLLCSFRINDVERWLFQTHDPARVARVLSRKSRFPSHYQALITAEETPLPARLDWLKSAAEHERSFFLTFMRLGDEQFHRGALFGGRRVDAIESFQRAVGLQPRFAPAWEHLAWVHISEGDSAAARIALDSLRHNSSGRGFSFAMATLLDIGYQWRFAGRQASTRSQDALSSTEIQRFADAVAGARLLMSMNEPRGAIAVGGMLAQWPNREAVRNGLLGQLFGYAALGRLDSVRLLGTQLAERTTDPALPLLALELEAVLRAFDPDPAVRKAPDLLAALDSMAVRSGGRPELGRRAAFALGILALNAADSAKRKIAFHELMAEPAPAPLRGILNAAVRGASDAAAALRELPPIPTLAAETTYSDPLEDAVVHFLRAEWLASLGRPAEANYTLRWHEHEQILGHLTGEPQAGELAWALGTLARYHRSGFLAELRGEEPCAVNGAIARLWANGESPFHARASAAGAKW